MFDDREQQDSTAKKNGPRKLDQVDLDFLLAEIKEEDEKRSLLRDSGSDSDPSGDNLSPDKLTTIRDKLTSTVDPTGVSTTSVPTTKRVKQRIRRIGSNGHLPGAGGHFHGLMRRYLNCRNLFCADDPVQIKNRKLSLLDKIVAFGRTTYISKNQKGASRFSKSMVEDKQVIMLLWNHGGTQLDMCLLSHFAISSPPCS